MKIMYTKASLRAPKDWEKTHDNQWREFSLFDRIGQCCCPSNCQRRQIPRLRRKMDVLDND